MVKSGNATATGNQRTRDDFSYMLSTFNAAEREMLLTNIKLAMAQNNLKKVVEIA